METVCRTAWSAIQCEALIKYLAYFSSLKEDKQMAHLFLCLFKLSFFLLHSHNKHLSHFFFFLLKFSQKFIPFCFVRLLKTIQKPQTRTVSRCCMIRNSNSQNFYTSSFKKQIRLPLTILQDTQNGTIFFLAVQ